MAKAFTVERIEQRVPMALSVSIAGHASLPGVESTFTENVSSRGARVMTVRRWRANDRLEFISHPGEFRRSSARGVLPHAERRWLRHRTGIP